MWLSEMVLKKKKKQFSFPNELKPINQIQRIISRGKKEKKWNDHWIFCLFVLIAQLSLFFKGAIHYYLH